MKTHAILYRDACTIVVQGRSLEPCDVFDGIFTLFNIFLAIKVPNNSRRLAFFKSQHAGLMFNLH